MPAGAQPTWPHLKDAEGHIDNLLEAVRALPFTGKDQEVRALDAIEGLRSHLRTVKVAESAKPVGSRGKA